MTIFAVIVQPGPNSERLDDAVRGGFQGAYYQLDAGHGWLVAAKTTTKELSDTLGITDGSNGAALVVEVASYFGRANPNIWSWIKTHWEMP